jgi:hypothetical protein
VLSAAWGEDHYDLIVMGNVWEEDEVVGESDKTRRPGSAYVCSLMSEWGYKGDVPVSLCMSGMSAHSPSCQYRRTAHSTP